MRPFAGGAIGLVAVLVAVPAAPLRAAGGTGVSIDCAIQNTVLVDDNRAAHEYAGTTYLRIDIDGKPRPKSSVTWYGSADVPRVPFHTSFSSTSINLAYRTRTELHEITIDRRSGTLSGFRIVGRARLFESVAQEIDYRGHCRER